MKLLLEKFRHWLPPLGAGTCVVLAGRVIFVGFNSTHSSPYSAAGPAAFLLVLGIGLYRRSIWARWIAAVLCLLAGAFCLVLLVTRFFPPGLFGPGDAPPIPRPPVPVTIAWLLPPALLLPMIGHLLRPLRMPKK